MRILYLHSPRHLRGDFGSGQERTSEAPQAAFGAVEDAERGGRRHETKAAALTEDLFLLLPAWELDRYPIPRLKEVFPDRIYLYTSQFLEGNGFAYVKAADRYSKEHNLPCIVTNRPLFHEPNRKPLQDVLTCIRHTCTLKDAGFRLRPNSERHLKSPQSLQELFSDFPQWMENTVTLAKRCQFSLDEIRYRYPMEWIPPGETGDSYLEKLAWQGAEVRYQGEIPEKARLQITKELALIRDLSQAQSLDPYAERMTGAIVHNPDLGLIAVRPLLDRHGRPGGKRHAAQRPRHRRP